MSDFLGDAEIGKRSLDTTNQKLYRPKNKSSTRFHPTVFHKIDIRLSKPKRKLDFKMKTFEETRSDGFKCNTFPTLILFVIQNNLRDQLIDRPPTFSYQLPSTAC
jgi:hypothetical protein